MWPHHGTGTNNSDLKSHNRSAVLVALLKQGRASRVQLAQQLRVSSSTITNLITELSSLGIVSEEGNVQNAGPLGVGRPQRALQLVPQARYGVGIHIDVGVVYVGICDLLGHLVASERFEHDLTQDWEDVLARAAASVQELIDRHDLRRSSIVGVGIAASGLVDSRSGMNLLAPNLGWHDVPLREVLSAILGMPVIVENNVRAMALGETLFGAARDVSALAFVYARMGVGAGLVMDGALYRGAAAGAGELGHTVLLHTSCDPQHTTDLESLVAEPAILHEAEALAQSQTSPALAHAREHSRLTLDIVAQAAREGDAVARILFEERACYMGLGLANLLNVFNPEIIIVGGIYARYADLCFGSLQESLQRWAFANLGAQVQLRPSTFGQQTGLVGAGALALDAFFYRPNLYPWNAVVADVKG